MKRPILFIGTMLLLCSWHAQVLTNTSWTITDGDYELGIGHFDGDTLSVATSGYPEENLSTYVENGSLFTISDLPPDDYCNGEVGEYAFEIVGNTLVFNVIEDNCTDRTNTLVSFTWTQLPTSLNDLEVLPWTLSPNPTSDMITIELEHGMQFKEFVLHDLSGRELMRMVSGHSKTIIDLSDVTPGIYLLSSANGRYSQRIVKR